jgi:hypothetical protein
MKEFIRYFVKLAICTLVIIALVGVWDIYQNMLMLPAEDIKSIHQSDDIFLGSSHTLYHINKPYYDSLTNRKAHVVATGAQYGLETIHYFHLLGENGLLDDKLVYIQLEAKENINRHPQKSWMMLNTKPAYLKCVYKNGSNSEIAEFAKASFVDFLSLEYFLKRKMKPYEFTSAEKIRKKVVFNLDEYNLFKSKKNGHYSDHFGQQLIKEFKKEIPVFEKKYNCKIIYYIAGGCHSNLYEDATHDLRWMTFMDNKDYWQDTNHLNGKGSRLYTKELIKHFEGK